jgi:hypothetical protein
MQIQTARRVQDRVGLEEEGEAVADVFHGAYANTVDLANRVIEAR